MTNRLRARPSAGFVISAVLVSCLALTCPAPSLGDACEDCHGDPRFFVQVPHISDYYKDWLGSPHKAAGVTCSQCHGGKPDAVETGNAHAGVINPANAASPLFYRQQPETCGRCHAENAEQFLGSQHYAALLDESNAPTCTTCHGSMSRRPYSRDIVAGACEVCHAEGSALANPEAIADAKEILHRLGMAKAYLGWSRLHYESQGWPDDSQSTVAGFQAAYDRSVDGIHRFDLQRSRGESTVLLTGLRAYFDAAWESLEKQRDAAGDD